ncbi:hypothetical protein P171DRAFT_488191 [Karstenula rhodostoma CBS 690.94]|uniref:Uncharacterized protein n=1 Tax=Karstenula rhodostoma CBS 690.94 TaxID=1392251 RepID=A0A9P4PEV0_9PLEO|nr:hypothetical protein P171DRAFT_488191 [Karstenula rhodostoma CBS 690.94]
MAPPTSTPSSSVSAGGKNYAVVFHKSRTPDTLPASNTIGTFATLAEAQEHIKNMAYILTEQHKADIDLEHSTGKTQLISKNTRTLVGSLWVETLEPDFGETTAIWHTEEKLWEVLVEDKLTKAERTFTLANFASAGAKPWERKEAWVNAGAAVVGSNSRTSTREEPGITQQSSRATSRRKLALDAIFARHS